MIRPGALWRSYGDMYWYQISTWRLYRKPNKYHLVMLNIERWVDSHLVKFVARGWWTGKEWDSARLKKGDHVTAWRALDNKHLGVK